MAFMFLRESIRASLLSGLAARSDRAVFFGYPGRRTVLSRHATRVLWHLGLLSGARLLSNMGRALIEIEIPRVAALGRRAVACLGTAD